MVADQAANSLFSFLAGLAAAQILAVEDFGLYATLFTAYLVARDSLRALVFDPFLIRYAASRTGAQTPAVLGLAAAGGVLVTVVAVGVAAAWTELTLATALAAAAAVLPLLVVDGLRSIDVVQRHPERAAALSGLLLVGAAVCGLWIAVLWRTVAAMFIGLLAGALVAAGSRWRRLRFEARPSKLARWMGAHRAVGVPIFLDYLASAGVISLAAFVLASIDVEQAAALRGAQMVAAPVILLYVALTQALTAEGSRLRATAPAAIERFGWWILVAMVASGIACLVVVAGFDSRISQVLGDSADVTEPVLVPMMLFTLASAPSLAASGVLRGRDRSDRALVARLWASVPFAAAVLVGAAIDGARGAVTWGAAAQLLTIGIWLHAVVATRPPMPTIDGSAS